MNEHTFVQKGPPDVTATERFAPETPYGFKTNSHGDAADTRRNQQHEMQADKLEALGNLAGGVAHDLNNLLGVILGFGELLVENLKSAPEQRRYAERIVAATQRSQLMVRQILTFDHGSPGESSAVVLRDAIAEFYDLLRATLPATTELALDDQAEGAMVLVDKTQLFQVILNLCVNGSDALADQQGTVRISIVSLDRARRNCLAFRAHMTSRPPASWTRGATTTAPCLSRRVPFLQGIASR